MVAAHRRANPGGSRREEGQALTGETDPETIAHELHNRYNGAIIVLKLDKDGCFVMAKGHAEYYPTAAGLVVDATGAGDAFDGAFLASYLSAGDLAAAAHHANSIGTGVVGR